MQIRMAQECDIEGISNLLLQICNVHHEGRPDLFKKDGKKYSPEQLKEIINDEKRPVLAAVDEQNNVLGYALCIINESVGDSDRKSTRLNSSHNVASRMPSSA